MMPRIALYAGSFDPVTNGHIDVVRQAARLADKLVLAIGVHPGKTPLFPAADRRAMLEETCGPLAKDAGLRARVRHLRRPGRDRGAEGRRDRADPRAARRQRLRLRDADGRHERRHGAGRADRVFAGVAGVRPITATLVRQIAGMGGDVSGFVPAPVAARLKKRFAGKPGI